MYDVPFAETPEGMFVIGTIALTVFMTALYHVVKGAIMSATRDHYEQLKKQNELLQKILDK